MSILFEDRERSTTMMETSPVNVPSSRDANETLSLPLQLVEGYRSELRKQRAREDLLIEELRRHRRKQNLQLSHITRALEHLSNTFEFEQPAEDGFEEDVDQITAQSATQRISAPSQAYEGGHEGVLDTVELDSDSDGGETIEPSPSPRQPPGREPERPVTPRNTSAKTPLTAPQLAAQPSPPTFKTPRTPRQAIHTNAAGSSPRAAASMSPPPLQSPMSAKALGKRKRTGKKDDEDTEYRPKPTPRKKQASSTVAGPSNATASSAGNMLPPRPAAVAGEEKNRQIVEFFNRNEREMSQAFRHQSENPIAFSGYGKPKYSLGSGNGKSL